MRLAAVVLCCSGCLGMMATPTPMTSLRDELPGGSAKCLVLFLPGAGDTANDFVSYGFVEALRQRGMSVDIVSANATLGYYTKGMAMERLHADVVTPARAKSYAQTWVMGMSMGGMGTLLYSQNHPDEVTGVLALAPFLGDRALSDEIRAAGGLASWQAPAQGNYQTELWRWLQAVTVRKEAGPKLYLGWGTEDRLGASAELLAATLPEAQVFRVPGGHKWTSWKKVLDAFLADSDFARSCR